MTEKGSRLARFGKSSEAIIDLHGAFLTPEGNQRFLDRTRALAAIYRKQPRRTHCKVCEGGLGAAPVPGSAHILFCPTCGHGNGPHQDTEEYYRAGFDDGEDGPFVSGYYASENQAAFERRVADIYRPKIDFLAEAIEAEGGDPGAMRFSEFGSGTGYLLAAARDAGFAGLEGSDTDANQVANGNVKLGEDLITHLPAGDLARAIAQTEAEIAAMIFVLEHVPDHHAVLAAIRDNPNIKYVLNAVPTAGFATFLEGSAPDVYARNSGGHNHLYTDSSLSWIEQAYGFQRIGEWWFGADSMDLMRTVSMRLNQCHGDDLMAARWRAELGPLIDALQLTLDRARLSSEVHLVWRVG